MIFTRYASFVSGAAVASLTWIVTLYLYSRLSQNSVTNHPTVFTPNLKQLSYNDEVDKKEAPSNNNFIPYSNEKSLVNKNVYRFQDKTNYKNSDKLLRQLRPVPVKPAVTLGSGLDELGMVRNWEDQQKRDQGYKDYAFNVLVSDNIGIKRDIPDIRNKLCKNQHFADAVLPNASIVICFYNEHYMTLLRSIQSIIDRTPDSLLHEIILVDDFSDGEITRQPLKDYISHHFNEKVKYFKTSRREGLIRARMFGAGKATGDVLIFLDSHIEVNVMWIEPLLSRIAKSKTIVPMPVIDIINADTFQYTGSPLVRGGFNWGLHFKWDNLPVGTLKQEEDFVKPIKSPTMAGGLFAINREYFIELGEYDAGMDIWGGENLEISFRIWMCGGKIELIPCSRVGHVFRRRRPYGGDEKEDTMLKNSLRVAYVWMDEFKKYFLKNVKEINYGEISDRIALRKRLNCQTFSWYLQNVYPELTLPDDDEKHLKDKWAKLDHKPMQPWHSRKRNYVDQYQIRLANSSLCVQSENNIKSKGAKLILASCLRIETQMWYETDKHELVLGRLLCLEASEKEAFCKLGKCHEMGGNQEWRHKISNGILIYNMASGTCLGMTRGIQKKPQVVLERCTKMDKSTITWELVRSKIPSKDIR